MNGFKGKNFVVAAIETPEEKININLPVTSPEEEKEAFFYNNADITYTQDDILNAFNEGYSVGKVDGLRDYCAIGAWQLTDNIRRKARGIIAPHKGKYGVEYVATILYKLDYTTKYSDRAEVEVQYNDITFVVVASTEKRLIKKAKKTIARFDQKVIQAKDRADFVSTLQQAGECLQNE